MATKDYNFYSEDNKDKWSHLLAQPLKRITYQVHPTLITEDNALFYLERLLYTLLLKLVITQPKTSLDVTHIIMNAFPSPLSEWALQEADAIVNSTRLMKKLPISLPVEKLGSLIAKEFYLSSKLDHKVVLYLLTVIDYMAADILKLAGNFVKNSGRSRIFESDIRVSMNADQALMSLFSKDMDPKTISPSSLSSFTDSLPLNGEIINFPDAIKEMVSLEGQYIRVLQKIQKILAHSFQTKEPRVFEDSIVEEIFGSLEGVVDLSLSIHGSLEDALEVARGEEDQETNVAAVGTVFNEHSSGYDFEEYISYARNYEGMVKTLDSQFKIPWVHKYFQDYFRRYVKNSENEVGTLVCAVRYLLPKLLLEPIRHMAYYLLEMIPTMLKICPSPPERQEFKDALDGMSKFQTVAEVLIGKESLPVEALAVNSYILNRRGRSKSSFQEIKELQEKIEGDTKDMVRCSQLIMEGYLSMYQGGYKKGSKAQERRVLLFDCLLLCCKPTNYNKKEMPEFKLREKFDLKKMHLLDNLESEETPTAFELLDSKSSKISFHASTEEMREEWVSALSYALTQEFMEARLEDLLKEERNSTQIEMPNPATYKFSEPDSEDNIVFEEAGENLLNIRNPPIRAATFHKLVERLTYHKFADPALVKTFLTTYRSFSTPMDLMEALIERYNIPAVEDSECYAITWGPEAVRKSEKLRRYKKEYLNPIKLRVLNVIRHWIEHHTYDFERDPSLKDKLLSFLETTGEDRRMQKWVETIRRILNNETMISSTFNSDALPIEYVGDGPPDPPYSLFSFHPVEVARQMTLIQSEYFRAVKVNELIGGAFSKGNKDVRAPNMVKLTTHFNNMAYFFQMSLVKLENLDERVALISRLIDIMQACVDLNNFCGMMILMTAFNATAISKLEHTWNQVGANRMKIIEAMRETSKDTTYKLLRNKLFTIEPPCVPHIGMFLTRIIHVEIGMKDTLSDYPNMINFTKRRRFCDIVGEIQQYQNQRFNLTEEKSIREYLLSQTLLEGSDADGVETLIHEQSIRIEPRDQPLPKLPRKFPNMPLHSPGHLPTRRPNQKKRGGGGLHISESTMSSLDTISSDLTASPTPKSKTLQGMSSPSPFSEMGRTADYGSEDVRGKDGAQNGDFLDLKPPEIPPRLSKSRLDSQSPIAASNSNTFPRASSSSNVEPLPPRSEHASKQALQSSDAPILPPRKPSGTSPNDMPPPRPYKPSQLNSQVPKLEYSMADV